MSKRLQVVIDEQEYEEIREFAEAQRMTVSEWVRQVLRDARNRERGDRRTWIVHEPSERYDQRRLPRRTRIEIDVDEALLDSVQARFHLPSRRSAVEYVLGRVAVTPMTREEALAMEGTDWDGDLDEIRGADPVELL